MKNKDIKITLIFTLIGIVIGAYSGIYQMLSVTEEMKQQTISQLGSMEGLVVVNIIQSGIFSLIGTFFGLKLARKVNLKVKYVFDKKGIILAIILAVLSAFIISASDKFIFSSYLPVQTTAYKFSLGYLILGVLYGGVIEELMLRLFFMSLIVFILWKIFARSKDRENIPNIIYVVAIFIATLGFAAVHLPITSQTIGLSTPIIARCFILNGIGGIVYGYLYWKKGLPYAICAHMLTHVFMQLVFLPIFS